MFERITRWIARLVACRHPRTYRERRPLIVGRVGPAPGTEPLQVWHFICEDCGHAEPCIDRTPDEHRRAINEGTPRRPRAIKQIRVDAFSIALFRIALIDQATPALVDCLSRLRRLDGRDS